MKRKTKNLSVRLQKIEKDELKTLARHNGVTPSVLVRYWILSNAKKAGICR